MSPACALVFALNSLVKPGMLIPWGPNVEPTGGAGVALPAGSCNLTTAVIFFAIIKYSSYVVKQISHEKDLTYSPTNISSSPYLSESVEIEISYSVLIIE